MKSRPGSSETEAYVFLISLFRSPTSISTSTAIGPPRFGLLGNWGGSERRPCLPGGGGNEKAARAREQGDDHDRGARRGGVGADASDKCAEDEAEVAPEAVDADDARTVARLAGVGDGRDQGRVDHCRADAEQRRCGERGPERPATGY